MRKSPLLLVLLPAALLADDVYLKGGGQVTGQIVERTEAAVKVDIGAGVMTVPMSSVVRIEGGHSPLQEYRERASKIAPGDASAWRNLGLWASGKSLATQSREAFSKVIAIDPNDAIANHALGRVQLEGRWVSAEESYRARGYIEFEHEWVTPEEKQAIVAERLAREQADDQAVAEQIQAEDARRQEQAAKEAQRKVEWDQPWPMLGDPVFFAWGPGPGTVQPTAMPQPIAIP